MQACNDKLSEVKAILRSHLIATSKTVITVPKLNSLYKDMEERNIPFHEFGYSNLVEFLKNIRDTVSLYTCRTTGELCVRHVDTEESAHISSLVSRQKMNKSSRRRSINDSNNRSNYHHKPSFGATKKTNKYSNSNSSYSGMFSGTGDKNFASNLTNNVFRNTTINNNSSKSTNSFSTNTANNYCNKSSNNYGTAWNSNVDKLVKPYKDAMSVLKVILKRMKDSKTTSGIWKVDLLTRVKKELFETGRDPKSIYSIKNLNNDLEELMDELVIKEDYIYFRDELAIIREQERRKLVTAKNDSQDNSSNNNNIEKNIPDKFNVNESPIVKDINYQNDEAIDSIMENSLLCPKSPSVNSNVSVLIKGTVKFRLQKLIENHPEGIWCNELPDVYKKEYNLELEYHELGFSDIIEFVIALPQIFRITYPIDNRAMVLNAEQSHSQFSSSYQKETLACKYNFVDCIAKDPDPVPIILRDTTCTKLFPDGVMKPDETVDIISVSALSAMEYFEVNISEIFTPSFFWVTLRKNKKKFKAMMNDLEEFYQLTDLDLYRIPQVLLKTGLNIACVYANIWHRGIIKKMKPDGYVVVLFYDYGTISTYHPSDVYFLHTKFSMLPSQAVASGLSNTCPINSTEWPPDHTQAFVNRVWNVPMIAMIASTNEENNTMMVTLTDTSDDVNDIHINDWMVEKKFATWVKMVCMKKNFIFEHYQKCRKTNNCTVPMNGKFPNNALAENSSDISSSLSNLQKFKTLHSDSSDYLLSSNETVYVIDHKNENIKQEHGKKFFNRCKNLMVKRTIDTSNSGNDIDKTNNLYENCQQDFGKDSEDLQTSTQFHLTREDKADSTINNNGLTVRNKNSGVALIQCNSFLSTSGDHGRMNNIDWSVAVNNVAVSACSHSVFNCLRA